MPQILIIDDRRDIRLSLRMLLEDAHLNGDSYQVLEADNPQSAQPLLQKNNILLIILDMNFTLDTTSGEEGLAFLRWLQQAKFNVATIALTAWSNTDLVVKAMQLGASDFIEKPWKNKQLLHAVEQQLALNQLQQQNAKLKQQLSQQNNQHNREYQWQSPCMLQLLKQIKAVAHTDVNILLTGDNGTGKSELAHFIHQHSARKNNDLISVNMGAISENLFESEMFGHKKGAFTDAKANRIGRFELAENGTLFLDEIANIPLSQQAKILRVLENGEYEVLGSSRTQQSNVRLISATNADFVKLISKELFREDLYYRLNTIELLVPPLRTRQLDIIPLAEFFMEKFCHKYQLNKKAFSDNAKQALQSYHWPGNIRELSHLAERAILLSENHLIELHNLNIAPTSTTQTNFSAAQLLPFMTLEQAEINLIKQALSKTAQHIPQAAQLLGLSKASMYRRIEKYGLATN
ncbi:MAG: sigma-54-dependent Fis family transcriptional regulator [Gammaproteobacteria bacterium]|nr:MAG: sigma-54-dependent Fis family transcriptional regulator [Gammaproteobacteria bacterium]